MNRNESQMIDPIRELLFDKMSVDISRREFSAGYGIADIVGAKMCNESCNRREDLGLAVAFDHLTFASVLLILSKTRWTPFAAIAKRVSISETTLQRKILPKLCKLKLTEKFENSYRLCFELPKPTQKLIAVEAKQKYWRQAILQARRYAFFAEETYIAIWAENIRLVDRSLLYRHRLGLIAVESDNAMVVVQAPLRRPRQPQLNFYSSEFFYGLALNYGISPSLKRSSSKIY